MADIISGFGTGMSFIGCNLFVLNYDKRNVSVGLMMMVVLLSGFLINPIAGTIADKLNRRNILIISNTLRAVVLILVALSIRLEFFKMSFMFILAATSGIGWTVTYPASRGLAQEILPPSEYVNGNSLIETGTQIGLFCAAGACGIIYETYGLFAILLIDALTFLISNIFLFKIDYNPATVLDESQSYFNMFINGWEFLNRRPLILWYGVFMNVTAIAIMSINVVLPGYVSYHLNAGPLVFGFSDMLYGIGACTAGLVVAVLIQKYRSTRLLSASFFTISISSLLFLVINKWIVGLYISFFFLGYSISSLRIIMNTKIMEFVPKSHMGRSQSVWMAFTTLMQIVSVYGIGILMDVISVRVGFLSLACIILVGFTGFLVLTQISDLNLEKMKS
ncbi:MAG: MFS transporter [Deltaproteobacteria bacterium]|nr:MFS transporter [Deltaproteobacteria bacterium]